MNQTFQPGGAENIASPPATPPLPLPPPLASRRDIEALANALIKGENAVVRRRDLAELLRRLTVTMEERAATAETARQARAEQIDQRLDSVEGALRIELAPMIGRVVAQEMQSAARPRPGFGRSLTTGLIAGLVSGLIAGLIVALAIPAAFATGLEPSSFYEPDTYDFRGANGKVFENIVVMPASPSLNGGIATGRNRIN